LPPSSERGRSSARVADRRSSGTTTCAAVPRSASRPATARACYSASWLPRVPIRSGAVTMQLRSARAAAGSAPGQGPIPATTRTAA
jgi:hypothetical protein